MPLNPASWSGQMKSYDTPTLSQGVGTWPRRGPRGCCFMRQDPTQRHLTPKCHHLTSLPRRQHLTYNLHWVEKNHQTRNGSWKIPDG